jgi:hypothetical protein
MSHNLKTMFLASKFVLPVMEKQASGVIVNLSVDCGATHERRAGTCRLLNGQVRRSRLLEIYRHDLRQKGHSLQHPGIDETRRWSSIGFRRGQAPRR